jgi:hypothetical protein
MEERSFIARPRHCVCVLFACSAAFGHILPGVSPSENKEDKKVLVNEKRIMYENFV